MEFQPGGSFVKPLKLDLKFVGMKGQVLLVKTDFFYIADDGTMVVIKNDGLNVNLAEERKARSQRSKIEAFLQIWFRKEKKFLIPIIIKERNIKMKKYISIIVLLSLFVIGCSDNKHKFTS